MRTILAFIAILTTAPLAGQSPFSDLMAELDRFDFFTECQGLGMDVRVRGNEASEMGLTRERVRNMVESRLRAARLYDSSGGYPALAVQILTLDDGPAFVIQVQLVKRVRDSITGSEGGAITSHELRFGTHGGGAGFIMQVLSEELDEFILEYLRINEAWCS